MLPGRGPAGSAQRQILPLYPADRGRIRSVRRGGLSVDEDKHGDLDPLNARQSRVASFGPRRGPPTFRVPFRVNAVADMRGRPETVRWRSRSAFRLERCARLSRIDGRDLGPAHGRDEAAAA